MTTHGDNPVQILGFLALGSVAGVVLLFGLIAGPLLALIVLALLLLAVPVVALDSIFGYRAAEDGSKAVSMASSALGRSIALGVVGAVALFGFYGGVMTTVNGVAHTVADIARYGFLLGVLFVGFGALVGIGTALAPRQVLSKRAVILAGIGTGVGTGALMTCCILPLVFRIPSVSILTLALYLNQIPVALVGIAANLAGIGWMTGRSRQLRTLGV